MENFKKKPEQNYPQFEKSEDIVLEEAKEGDTDYDSVMEVSVYKETSQEEIEKEVRKQLEAKNWWLEKYWQEKGVPKEQVDVKIGENLVTLFNFGEPLEEKHYEEL